MKPAIRVEKLSKSYRLAGKKRGDDNLTERLTGMFRSLARRLTGRGPTKPSEEFWALRQLDFEVQPGEVIGVIGKNGAGKSTLLKILSRVTEPTTGRVELRGRLGSLLEVGTGFHPELTGRENVFLNGSILGMSRREIARKFDEIVAFADIEQFLDTPVKRYSSGMYTRLAFAVAAHLELEILVVDEVLAVGDAEFQQKCLGKMNDVARNGRTVLFVSHNMGAVEKLCSKGLFLKKGVVHREGPIRDVIQQYLGEYKTNEIRFENQPLLSFGVRQVEDGLEFAAEFALEESMRMTNLGFVISDYLGNPVCGSNPMFCGESTFGKGQKQGRIKVVMEQPILRDGTYRVSVWFGDGKEDRFHAADCLIFDVQGMAGTRQLPAALVGPVKPICNWSLESV